MAERTVLGVDLRVQVEIPARREDETNEAFLARLRAAKETVRHGIRDSLGERVPPGSKVQVGDYDR